MLIKMVNNSHGESASLHVDIDLELDSVCFVCKEFRNGYSKSVLCASLKEAHDAMRKAEKEIMENEIQG